MEPGSFRHGLRLVWLVSFLCLLSPVARGQNSAAGVKGEPAQLWADGVSQIVQGRFDEARQSISRLLAARPGDENYSEIASWLDNRDRINEARADLHAKQRGIFTRRAQRSMEQEELAEALAWTKEAIDCATGEPKFMREAWVQDLHDRAATKAQEHKSRGEWAEATSLYYGLKLLFEGNTSYEDNMRECLAHSRLEAVYRPDSKWRSRFQGITPRIVDDTLWQIHGKYVTDVDFKIIARESLKRLLLLAECKSVVDVFPSLGDEDKRTQYVNRIRRLLRKVNRLERFGYSDLEKDIFDRVLKINSQTVQLPRELIVYEFLEGALAAEDTLDQFTSMIWPADYAEFEKHTQGHFSGVGIQITLEDNQLTVVSPLEDTPAFRSGIQAGDKITHIDGEPTDGLSLTGAVQSITGPVGTDVLLTIYRPQTKTSFQVQLKREDIRIYSVKGYQRQADSEKWNFFIDRGFGIGYIRITNFAESTTAELRRALEQLEQQHARALILDLRFNPGGLLRSAIEVSELFLPQDKLIVATEGLHSEPFSRVSKSRGRHNTLPLVVLVNEHSASASEIVSGALKDHKRAIIVGERSFGKGSVQNLIPVGNTHAHLKLTTAYYYLPSGRCLHRLPDADAWGVEPDIEVELVPRERLKIRSMRRDADVIRSLEEESAPESSKAPEPPASDPATPEPAAVDPGEPQEPAEEILEYPDVDYQLETALLVLRVQLLQKLGFEILPKVKLGTLTPAEGAVVTN